MTRKLLLEHGAPLMTRPTDWKVELVTPERFGESLIESHVASIERRFNKLTESLLAGEKLTEENARSLMATIKDEFVSELRESSVSKRMRVSGPAQVENQRNGNGRVYPTELWDRVLGESSEFNERLRSRQVLGELEHPAEGNTKLPRVSHLVEKVWRNNGVVYAQHLIFKTPGGSIIEELYRAGAVPGVSSRGAGSTRTVDDTDVVEANDFHLDTWDFVAQPSVATARPSKIGESGAPPVSGGANWTPKIVTQLESHGEPSMSHSVLVESSHNIATARLAIQKSDIVLNARKPKLAAVMESQQEVVAAMGALSTPVPTELAGEVSSLRAGLSERSTTLRRMVNNLLSEDEDQPSGDDDGGDDKPKGEVPPQFQKKDGEGDDKEGAVAEQIASILKAEGLDAKSIANVLEELATRCATYQRQLEGAVPRDKYRTAIRLGEAVVARAKSDKQVYEGRIAKLGTELAESRRTEKAATAMLEATVSRYRTEKVEGVVEELISKNPRLRPIESKLRECKDVGELTSLVESTVKPLVEGKPNSRPDLPLPHGNGLNEDRTPKRGRTSPAPNVKQNSGGNGLMEMLTESERGGYVKV